jgi:EpsI family protein
MIARAVLVLVLLGSAALLGSRTAAEEAPVTRETLGTLPYAIDRWRGMDARPLTNDVVAVLGVDDYVHRTYVNEAGVPANLYAGYYHSQRQGDTIHSPQNCLPGAGWQPVSSETIMLRSRRGDVPVNQYVIQKGLAQQVVLYWYQGRGRVVANEYKNKALLMWDAATMHRTNGGLVRVMVPIAPDVDARGEASTFASALLPYLERLMP